MTWTWRFAPPPVVTAGTNWKSAPYARDVGSEAIVSPLTVCCRRTLCTSTTGASPVTVTVSSIDPTFSSMFTVATNAPVNSMPWRFTELNPGSEKATEYVPGRRSTMRYWPELSVMAVRTFSMSAGLAASTATPGNTAPEASFTTPVIEPCASASDGRQSSERTTTRTRPNARIRPSPTCVRCASFEARYLTLASHTWRTPGQALMWHTIAALREDHGDHRLARPRHGT